MAQVLYEEKLDRPGVWLPEQIIDPTSYLSALTELGLHVQAISQGGHALKAFFLSDLSVQ